VTAKKSKGISPELEKAIADLLTQVTKEAGEGKLLDKLRVIDRALALEKIKQKISDDEWGSGFQTLPDEEEEAK
jgi:hypothetical protein